MPPSFDHEKLIVYQEALVFCAWVGDLLETTQIKASVRDQIDRASTSIPLNIAEGNAKFSSKDRCRFLEIAAGSTLECAACLDVMVARKIVDAGQVISAKERLVKIHNLTMGLLRKFSPHVEGILREEETGYGAQKD